MSSEARQPEVRHGGARLRRSLRVALFAVLLAGSALQWRVGWADNGDFARLMTWVTSGPRGFEPAWPDAGTAAYERRFWNYTIERWRLDLPMRTRWVSSVVPLWIPGVLVNAVFVSREDLLLPMVSLGARAASLLLLLLLFRWIDRSGTRGRTVLTAVLGIPFVLVSVNTDLVSYFTSFYQEPSVYVFLLLLCAAVVHVRHRTPSPRTLLLLAGAGLLLATTKLSNLYWPLLAALFGVRWRMLPDRRKALVALAGVAVLPLALTLTQASLVGSRHDNAYQALYCGVLTFSEDVPGQLAAMGLDGTERYLREPAYTPDGRAFIDEHGAGMTHTRVLGVIAREPLVAWRMLAFAADSMQRMTLTHLGRVTLVNDTTAAASGGGHPRLAGSAFTERSAYGADGGTVWASWSRVKAALFPRGTALLAALAVFLCAGLLLARGRGFSADAGRIAAMTALGCAIDMWMQIFGDGRQDLIKHLFHANLLFDVSLVCLAAALTARVLDRSRAV